MSIKSVMPSNHLILCHPLLLLPSLFSSIRVFSSQECIEDYLPFDTNGLSGEHFALKVRGESMLNAGILPGDLVVVHQQRDARNGEIVVAMFEEEATVKTLSRRDGHTWLLPENEAYDPIDGDNAEIIGKVVGVVRRY